jgi:hypothetical protein
MTQDYKEIAQLQKRWVDELNKVTVAPVMVSEAQSDGVTPSIRYYARDHDWRFPYQYRRCLPNELFFDIDVRDWDIVRFLTNNLTAKLDELNVPYELAGSGGKGTHIHVFFKAIPLIRDYGFRQVREKLWAYVMDDMEIMETMRGPGKPFCNATILCGDSSMFGKVMREFGGSKGKNRKTIIDSVPEKKEDVYEGDTVFPAGVKVWDIPMDVFNNMELKTKNYTLNCDYCAVDPGFAYEQAHYMDDWGRLKVKSYICSSCEGRDW